MKHGIFVLLATVMTACGTDEGPAVTSPQQASPLSQLRDASTTTATTSCRRLSATLVAHLPNARTGATSLTAGAIPADCPPKEIQCNMDLVATCERNFGTVECDSSGCTCHVC